MSEMMEQFDKLLADEGQVNAQLAIAMRQVCESAQIGRTEFEQAFNGISYATWRNYLNPSYQNSRSVSVLAAFSWYTGVSMNSFYLGENLCAYLGVSMEGLRLLTVMSQLDGDAFEMACQMAFGLIEKDRKETVREAYLKGRLLHKSQALRCPFPKPLDLKAFTQDYTRSCALGICQLQASLGYSDGQMAQHLGLSIPRYMKMKNPEDNTPIPAIVAARFKVSLKLEETAFMLDHMNVFPEFAKLRHFQDSRDRIILPLLENLTPEHATKLHQALRTLFL